MAIPSPKVAVSMPLAKAPALTTATAISPIRESKKNSADPNSLSNSRDIGSAISNASAPISPPIRVHM